MDYLSLLYCLSNLSGAQAEPYVTFLKSKLKYTMGSIRDIMMFYVVTFEERRSFPDLPFVFDKFGINPESFNRDTIATYYGDGHLALEVLWAKYQGEIEALEIKSVESQLLAETDATEKKKLLDEYNRLMVASVSTLKPVCIADTDINVVQTKTDMNTQGLVWPIEHLNETLGPLVIGENAVIIGGPGSFKTSFAINMMYHNSVLRDYNGVYVYLEDLPGSYQKKLVSRYSLGIGRRLDKDLFLRGTDDPALLASMKSVWDQYQKDRQGSITYVSMGDFPSDPMAFAHAFARFTTERQADYVIFDYAQRMRGYTPGKLSETAYLNHFFTTFNTLALGGYKNRKFAGIILSQLTKEGERKVEKTKGRLSKADAAEISALERDAFVMLSLFANDEMKSAGSLVYQVLKARNGETSEEPTRLPIDPIHVYLGDVSDLDDTYSVESLSSTFAQEAFDL